MFLIQCFWCFLTALIQMLNFSNVAYYSLRLLCANKSFLLTYSVNKIFQIFWKLCCITDCYIIVVVSFVVLEPAATEPSPMAKQPTTATCEPPPSEPSTMSRTTAVQGCIQKSMEGLFVLPSIPSLSFRRDPLLVPLPASSLLRSRPP